VQSFAGEFFRAANVVDVIGVAAVDHDVADVELTGQLVQRSVHHAGRNHQPDGARLGKLFYEVVQRSSTQSAFPGELLHGVRAAVVDHPLVTVFLQPPHHIGAHPAQSNHAQLHRVRSSLVRIDGKSLSILT
jgi:hypothetical protein